MAVYLVTYDGAIPGPDGPQELLAELRKIGAVRLQLSVWLLDVAETAAQVRDAFKSYMDPNDRIFVVEITPAALWAGYRMMPPSDDWLFARRP